MEKISLLSNNKEAQMNLPPGFRFHPTDEELITYYLFNKATHENFSAIAIAEVDIYKSEPWDLPWKAKMGEEDWYFFSVRDQKYQTGSRTNRNTEAGYWKSTGIDGEIHMGKWLIGKKKTLVFYKGRAPTGERTNWVMREYRLDEKFSVHNSSRTLKNEWVVCRVFRKASGRKKTHISSITRFESNGNGLGSSVAVSPPLVGCSPYYTGTSGPMISTDSAHVPCFSSLRHVEDGQAGMFNSLGNSDLGICSNPQEFEPRIPLHGWLDSAEPMQAPMNLATSYSGLTEQEQDFLDGVFENHAGWVSETEQTVNVSHETDLTTTDMNPEISSMMSGFDNLLQNPYASPALSMDLDHFWNYY